MANHNKRGIALVIVVGVLSILSLIATAFAILMMLEQKDVASNTAGIQARYLAEGGIARAIAELRYGADGAVNNAVDSQAESWYAGYDDAALLGGTGSYHVDIIDCASRINVNNTQNTNLTRILSNLNTALGFPLAPGDCQNIANNAPYLSEEEIEFKAGLDDTKYRAIKDSITIYGWADPNVINPQDAATPYSLQPRTPVNVNTASREVLAAVFDGLAAGVNSISSTEAMNLADHVIGGRPYRTWDDLWNRLLSAEPAIISDGDAAVLMANCDPNTDIMSLNPNNSWRYKHISKANSKDGVDKTALTANTTELSFSSGGYYVITSTGEVKNAAGIKIAEKKITTAAKIFDIWRQTTQAQFEQGVFSAPEGGAGATGKNMRALQTYPEPLHAAYAANANYDGQIMLAANDLGNAGSTAFLKASFATDLNADAGKCGGDPTNIGDANDDASVVDAANRSDLMPDGCLTRRDNTASKVGYAINKNANNRNGTLEMWFKPEWDSAFLKDNSGSSPPYTCSLFSFRNLGAGITEADGGGYLCTFIFYSSWSMQVECRLQGRPYRKISEPQPLNVNDIYYGLPGEWGIGKWQHIAVTWDYSSATDSSIVLLYMNGIQRESFIMISDSTKGGCAGLFNGTDPMGLGWDPDCGANHSDGTMDEIKVYDYAKDASAVAADYLDGVYYDASDAAFTSSPKNISPATLGTISWTEHLPPDINGADIEFDVNDGAAWKGYALSDPAGCGLGIGASGPIEYRASFKETDSSLRDTPVLDDVTVTYMKKIQFLYWRGI